MLWLRTLFVSGLVVALPGVALGTSYTIETEPDASWRAIGPQSPQGFETANTGWNSSLAYDDSDAAGWSSAAYIRTYNEGDGEALIWSSNLADTAYFRHKFVLDGPVLSALMNGVIDDDGQIYVNGTLVWEDINGAYTDFTNLNIAPYLHKGTNLIAVKAWDVILLEAIGLHITVETVPEPSAALLISLAAVPLLRRRSQRDPMVHPRVG